ncbi:EF-hand domain-containing protein [Litoreibacter roseus]|uniref:EF-hand domain-containing protein n=1 Tax=Litoreibacter roseus TaxID=2601869 RepID=A0A6N6JIZ7_9RHOB|nr:EF-hand domain-containing protein [Litoreibacter roseus]GFE65800.1 hypothetical protein KIN_28740 [Litoreibacter roseus]
MSVRLITTVLTLILPASGAVAQMETHSAGRALAEQFASGIDVNSDGTITFEELNNATDEAFASVDTDGDGSATFAEMRDWKYGFGELATFQGRDARFTTSIAIVFDIFDRDNDGLVTLEEHQTGIVNSSQYADTDEDGVLTFEEYYEGFIYNIAMRNVFVE